MVRLVPPRPWSWWSEHKLDILSDYLRAFTTASKRAGTTVYLDLFAGSTENVSRERGHDIQGSPLRALAAEPPFSVLRFFELPNKARQLEAELTRQHPDRNIRVYPGDCNDTIGSALAELRPLNWAPTFAFIDQQSTEIRWTTLRALADHKRRGKPKVELWILCASGMLRRGLSMGEGHLNTRFADEITDMLGVDTWLDAWRGLETGYLSKEEFRDELRNLMRWRLERELGYRSTQVFKVVNTNGLEIYDMIFATDHPAGHKIMSNLYGKATRQQPRMRQEALRRRRERREEERGISGLFGLEEIEIPMQDIDPGKLYTHEPPREPYRFPR